MNAKAMTWTVAGKEGICVVPNQYSIDYLSITKEKLLDLAITIYFCVWMLWACVLLLRQGLAA